MIVRSGNAVSFLVEFPSGPPDGDVDWSVLGPDGATLDSDTLIVSADAVSATITIPSDMNTLGVGDLLSYRDVVWSYTVGGQVVNGEGRYTVEARVPFGVSNDGVRNKLGVNPQDLPDQDISLMRAYLTFTDTVTGSGFPTGPYADAEEMAIRDAIEAMAALAVLPTMQVRVALKEGSGTDSFQRDKVDWATIAANLEGLVAGGLVLLLPTYDLTSGFGSLFILAPPSGDPFTA